MCLQEDNEGFDATALVNNCSVEEAKYLLEHFIQTSIGRVRSKWRTHRCREKKLEIVLLNFINFDKTGTIVKISESESTGIQSNMKTQSSLCYMYSK